MTLMRLKVRTHWRVEQAFAMVTPEVSRADYEMLHTTGCCQHIRLVMWSLVLWSVATIRCLL